MRKYKYIVLEGQGTTNRKEPVEEWEYWAPKNESKKRIAQKVTLRKRAVAFFFYSAPIASVTTKFSAPKLYILQILFL